MPEPDGKPSDAMRPDEALATMANMTKLTGALRLRMEGLTLVLWGICMAASYLTIAVPILGGRGRGGPRPFPNQSFNGTFNGTFGPPRGPPPTEFFFNSMAPLVWLLIAVVVTIVLWRAMSISFQTGITTPRLVAVLIGWLLLFAVTAFALNFVGAENPRAWHLVAWGFVAMLFAILNPLRFHERSRWAVAAASVIVLIAGAYAVVAGLDGRDTSFLAGLAIGLPMLVAGLYLMVAD